MTDDKWARNSCFYGSCKFNAVFINPPPDLFLPNCNLLSLILCLSKIQYNTACASTHSHVISSVEIFQITILHKILISPMYYTCPFYLIPLYLITLTIMNEHYIFNSDSMPYWSHLNVCSQ